MPARTLKPLMIALALAAAPAAAQVTDTTSAGNPTVATQRVASDVVAPAVPDPALTPVPDPRMVTAPAQAAAPDPSDSVKIRVNKIEVQGLTGLNAPHVGKLKHKYEGREVTLGDLRLLAIKMGRALRARGYFLARVVLPVQDVSAGVVKLVVSEGKYGGVEVTGNKHYTSKFIKRFFEPATERGVVRLRPLEKALLTINEFPDLKVRSSFKPGKEPGESDVLLAVTDSRPLHVGFDYNNYGNRLVGRNRAGVSLWAGSAAIEGDELFLHVVEQFPGDSDPIYQGSYTVPVGDEGARVAALATRAKTRVGGALTPLDIRGEAEIYSVVATQPVERSTRRANNFQLGLHAKRISNLVFGNRLVSQDDLREVTLGYNGYNVYRDFQFVHGSVITQGLGTAFNGTPNGDALSSRAFGGNGFTKVNSDLLWAWRTGKSEQVIARGAVQVATRPLPTAEMFGVGGPDSVRGFIQSEFLCDDGYLLSVEYRRALLEQLAARGVRMQAVVFADHGGGSLHHPLPGQNSSDDLTGVGIGLRAAYKDNTSVRLDLGVPVSVDRNVQRDQEVLYAQAATRY